MIDKALAQDQYLFIIAASVEKSRSALKAPPTPRDTPPRNPSRASMRPLPNRSCLAIAAVATALRGVRVARFAARRNVATPFPIPL
jgi:hypothetical protein